jgi:hypothetical protein
MIRLGGLVAAMALCLLVAAPASGAQLIGKDGKVYACYKTKGEAKGSVRLVAKKGKCRKGERKTSWNATGPAGTTGSPGEGGSNGGPGEGGAPGATGLETKVNSLLNRVDSLEDRLKGITNLALTEVISKLQGLSATQLQQAVAAVANVNALCTQAKKLTEQSNLLSGALAGISLTGATGILAPLGLSIPTVPALPNFGC